MLKALIGRSLLVLGVAIAATTSAGAHGAVAIGGNTADTAKYGIAVGFAVNQSSQAVAESAAVAQCKTFDTSYPEQTTKHCAVVATFDHEWLSVSMDPQNGTPGFGWSVNSDQKSAERNALSQCKASSTDERKSFCVISVTKHDESP